MVEVIVYQDLSPTPEPSNALEIFKLAKLYYQAEIQGQTKKDTGFSKKTRERLGQMFAYAETHPEIVMKRADQLDGAISNFNFDRQHDYFRPEMVNALELDRNILKPETKLPLIQKTDISADIFGLFALAHKEIARRYYQYIDSLTAADHDQLMRHMITATLVDIYGLAAKMSRLPVKNGQSIDREIVVNALLEETNPGSLQDEAFETGWFDPTYGFSLETCERIQDVYADRHPQLVE